MSTPHKDTDTFTMALRELFMDYFKGNGLSIVRPSSCDLRLTQKDMPRRDRRYHNYERTEWERRHYQYIIWFGTATPTVFGEVAKNPDEVTFYPGVWERSPELQTIYTDLKSFFHRYLPGVQLKQDKNNVNNDHNDGSDDQRLNGYGKRRDPAPPQLVEMAYTRYAELLNVHTFGTPFNTSNSWADVPDWGRLDEL